MSNVLITTTRGSYNNTTYEYDDGKTTPTSVPGNILLSNLRWTDPQNNYSGSPYKLNTEAIKTLRGMGFITLSDMKGVKKADIKGPGIGNTAKKRLVRAIKLAGVAVRGVGWPGEVPIMVPSKLLTYAREATDNEDEAKSMVQSALDEFVLGVTTDEIRDAAVAKKKQTVKSLRKQIATLNAEIKGA